MRSRLPTCLISQFEVTGGGAVFLRIFLTSLSNPLGQRLALSGLVLLTMFAF
jgi:hypothetical protein